jgi:myo-inositol 2-dehydrogenase/D-chiro-inositol 1-dehydrogenase
MSKRSSRRDFLKTSAVAGGAVAAGWSAVANVHAGGNNNALRVGLVGCGGRGTGAAEQCLRADSNVRLVAIADVFRDRAERCLTDLRGVEAIATRVAVPNANIFVGLGAYQQVLQNCDLVLLATPPGFRPIHITAAVAARKHIFTEKPVGVDGPGIRAVLAAYDTANQHHLAVVAGTQRRNQTGYVESMQRIHAGDIGTITSATCYWNQGGLWHRNREPGQSDVAWQLRNWLYFTWLSGDHICEQHVHNLDVINWALGTAQGVNAHPVRCVALGGRQARTAAHFGHIYDHFAVDYEYPGGVHVLSTCRQIENTPGRITETVTGTRGVWKAPNTSGPAAERRPNYQITGERPWTFQGRNDNHPYEQEHVALIRSIRQGKPINDLRRVAESTLTAIMGRMAAYSGQVLTWEDALNSQLRLMPENLTMDTPMPVPAVAIPGVTRAF